DRRGRAGDIEHSEPVDPVMAGQQHEHGNAADESTEPGKAAAEPIEKVRQEGKQTPGPAPSRKKPGNIHSAVQDLPGQTFTWRIDHVPQLGADDSSDGHIGDHTVGVDLRQVAPLDLSVQYEIGGYERRAHEQAKSGQSEISNVNVR